MFFLPLSTSATLFERCLGSSSNDGKGSNLSVPWRERDGPESARFSQQVPNRGWAAVAPSTVRGLHRHEPQLPMPLAPAYGLRPSLGTALTTTHGTTVFGRAGEATPPAYLSSAVASEPTTPSAHESRLRRRSGSCRSAVGSLTGGTDCRPPGRLLRRPDVAVFCIGNSRVFGAFVAAAERGIKGRRLPGRRRSKGLCELPLLELPKIAGWAFHPLESCRLFAAHTRSGIDARRHRTRPLNRGNV